MDDLLNEVKRQWMREDIMYQQYLKRELAEFGKLYLNNFDKPLYREINTMVIKDLTKDLGVINARLYKNKAGSRSVRYRLEENTTTAG